MTGILNNREQFLADRRTGIGGSDAAALIGLSPFKTEHDVYMEKVGLSPPSEPSMRMEAGLRLEPVLAEWYANEKGVHVKQHPMERHEKYPFMIAHVDRLVYDDIVKHDRLPLIAGLLEIKTADVRFAWLWGEPGTDSVPDVYNLQCQHYLSVTGLKWADIAVLIGGNDFRIYRVPRNDELIKNLIRIEKDFWTYHVEKQIPPEVAGTEASKKLLAALYPHDSGHEVLADDKIDPVVQEYFEHTEQIKNLESAKLLRENQIKVFMGEASLFKGPGYRFSWKQSKDRIVTDWKAVVGALDPPPELLKKHTTEKPGARPFRPTKTKESSDDK